MWEMFVGWIFDCIAWFQGFVLDWGMAIVIITVIFRLIIFPISFKQNKSSYMMNKLQPKIKEVQELYKDDKMKQSEETQRLYKEAHFNPLSGCLPLLLQMPIFIALFQALQSMQDRVAAGTVLSFYGMLPDLTITPVQAFQNFGIVYSIPYFIFALIFAASVIVPMLINKNSDTQTKVMMIIMTVFMGYVATVSPGGVLLYWDISSIIGVATQLWMKEYYTKRDEREEAVAVKPVKVNVVRKEKKARPTKKK